MYRKCEGEAGTHVVVVIHLLLLRVLQAVGAAEVACRLDAHHVAVPGRRAHGGQAQNLLLRELPVRSVCKGSFIYSLFLYLHTNTLLLLVLLLSILDIICQKIHLNPT